MPSKIKKEPTEIYKLLEAEKIEFTEKGRWWYEIFLPLKRASGLGGFLGKKVPAKTLDDIVLKICGMGNKVEYYNNQAVFTTPDGKFVTAAINVKGYKTY